MGRKMLRNVCKSTPAKDAAAAILRYQSEGKEKVSEVAESLLKGHSLIPYHMLAVFNTEIDKLLDIEYAIKVGESIELYIDELPSLDLEMFNQLKSLVN